jgi:hypothetical protein
MANSAGGNDFRGYVGGQGGTYAIHTLDLNTPPTTIPARGNIFSVLSPQSVVIPSTNTSIDTANPMLGAGASLAAMFASVAGAPTMSDQINLGAAPVAKQSAGVVHSTQVATAFVDGLYVSLLGRSPGAGEDQTAVTGLVKSTLTEEQLITIFVTSLEYFNKVTQGSAFPNGAWVQSLYTNILGRQGSGTEVNAGITALAGGMTQADLATMFVKSTEFRTHQVQAFYGVPWVGAVFAPNLLKRTSMPTDTGIAAAVNSTMDLLTIEAGILASDEFASKG